MSTSAPTGDALHIEIENTGTLEEAERLAPAPVAASASRTCGGASTCTIPAATPSRWQGRGNKVVATLVLEGEPCSGS